MSTIWIACGLWLAGAEDPDALVKKLGADEFAVREDAERQLQAQGQAARAALESGAKSPDLEIRRRAAALLAGLRGGDLWQGSKVKFAPGKTTVKAAFAALAEQTGNPVRWKDNEPAADATVELDGVERGYWDAFQWLCQKTGTFAQFPEDRRALGPLLAKGNPGKFPSAVVGPLRLRVDSVSRQTRAARFFVEDEVSIQDDLQIQLELHWERRAALCRHAGRLRVLEARTPGGVDLRVPPPEGRNVPIGVRRSQPKQSFQHTLKPPAPGDAKLAKLRVELDAEIAGDFAALEVPFQPGATAEMGGWSALLERLNGDPKDCLLTLRRPEALGLTQATPDLADESVEIVGDRDRMWLLHRSVEHSGPETKYRFMPPTARFEPRKIEIRVAKARSPRTVEFVFENVPLAP